LGCVILSCVVAGVGVAAFPIMEGLKFLLIAGLISAAYSKIYFEETFSDGDAWESRWIQSKHSDKEFGVFERTAGKFFADDKYSQGIRTTQDARFYGLSTKFEEFSNKDKTLVIQFSVKHEQNIDCGGGYIKVFGADLDPAQMHGESPYKIMFGPDICGPGTKRVHVIFSYKGENKLIKEEIRPKDDVLSHLYTLVVKPDNTYEVRINNEKVQDGSLEEHWDFLPAKEIKDPSASKPEDWEDKAMIDDPEDTKPEDWVETEHIPDPDAKKPEDWDDEMDGEWEPPMIDNSEYKGAWSPKQIDNPKYKGEWKHPMIPNPDYAPDSSIYAYDSISAVGIDLWQVKSGSIFDNLLITDDLKEAEAKAEEFLTHKKTEDEKKTALDEEEKKKSEAEAKAVEDDEDKDDSDEEEDIEPEIAPEEKASEADAEGHDEL